MRTDNYKLMQLISDTIKDSSSVHFSTTATIAGILHPYAYCLLVTRWLLQLKTQSCPKEKEGVGCRGEKLARRLQNFFRSPIQQLLLMSHYLNLGYKSPLDQSLKGWKMGREYPWVESREKEKGRGSSDQSTNSGCLTFLPKLSNAKLGQGWGRMTLV